MQVVGNAGGSRSQFPTLCDTLYVSSALAFVYSLISITEWVSSIKLWSVDEGGAARVQPACIRMRSGGRGGRRWTARAFVPSSVANRVGSEYMAA